MVWTLLAIKGENTDYPYFQNNKKLAEYLNEIGITFVSTLDPLNPEDLSIRKPIHQFLHGFYPFYRNDRRYLNHENSIVDGIIANIRNPQYLKFLFKELGIFGEDGPYAIVFDKHKVSVKFMGQAGWNSYGIGLYLSGPDLYPPKVWEEKPVNFKIPFPKKGQIDTKFSSYNPDLKSLEDLGNDGIALKNTKIADTPPADERNIRKVKYDRGDDVIKNPKTKIPLNWLNQIEAGHKVTNKAQDFDVEFHENYAEIPPEALRLMETIREQQLELGFQQLMQIIQFKQNLQLPKAQISPVKEILKMNIDSHYTITLDDPIGVLKLEPLHRSVYIIFLQHPNGIDLYDLRKYRDPLLHIYKEISQRELLQPIIESIDRLVNRHDNSIYEKISRINKTIKERLQPHDISPSPYLIVGKRGEAKRVFGSRDWVNWE